MKNKLIAAMPQLLLGLLAAYGGMLHFTMDVSVWKNPFLTSLYQTGYLWQIIGIINFAAGVLLIINRFTTAALLVLLPITFNILLYHIFFYTGGIVHWYPHVCFKCLVHLATPFIF
jgi:putative oxidoreductase